MRYGPEMARSILNNHDTSLFLRTKDTKTAKYFSDLAGETTVKHKQKSSSYGRKDGSKSISEQYVKRPLITQGELLNMDKNTCYLFVSGSFPMKLEKAWQFNIYGDMLNHYEKYRSSLGYTSPLLTGRTSWEEEEEQSKADYFVEAIEEPEVIELDELNEEENKEIPDDELQMLLGNSEEQSEAPIEEQLDETQTDEDLLSSLAEIEDALQNLDEMEDGIDDEALLDLINELSEEETKQQGKAPKDGENKVTV